MVTINSSSLFHFTSKKDVLKKILSTGYSFCFESFGKNQGMAVPMICFCDIPITRSPKHRSKFGNYAIGLNKEQIMFHHNLNPVHYVTSFLHNSYRSTYSSVIIKSLEKSFKDGFRKVIDNSSVPHDELFDDIEKKGLRVFGDDTHYELESFQIAKFAYKQQLTYTKVYRENLGGKKINYYDENEWRMVPHYNTYDDERLPCIEDITFEDFKKRKSEFLETVNKANNAYFTIPAKDINKAISTIIVKDEKMVASIIKHILKSKILFGSDGISDDDRLLLISKITSFERIENDY